MRIVVFIVMLYLIYFFYKLSQKSSEKNGSKKTDITSCPSPAIFIDYTKGKIKGEQKQELYNHITNCKDCQRALQCMFDIPVEEEFKNKPAAK